ncbi:MAG: hypothetical protein LBI03_01740 [Clostridiales bacterium]|nr:hypothetical protein [Clostridiales bacterium]
MKLESNENSASRTIQLISGIPAKEVMEMFENIGIYATLSYFQNGKILIPFIGEVTARNDSAGLQYEFEPSQFLTRNIGQIENGEETDFENILTRKFRDILPGQMHRKNKKAETQEIATEAQESLV